MRGQTESTPFMLPETLFWLTSYALESAILIAILFEIFFSWRWQKEARKWHQEEMAQWRQENEEEKDQKTK